MFTALCTKKDSGNNEPRELTLGVHIFITSTCLLVPLALFGYPKKRRFEWCRP